LARLRPKPRAGTCKKYARRHTTRTRRVSQPVKRGGTAQALPSLRRVLPSQKGQQMTALILVTATACQVIVVPDMATCYIVAQSFLPFGRVFCWPAGVVS